MDTYEVWDDDIEDKIVVVAHSMEEAINQWLLHENQEAAVADMRANGFDVEVRNMAYGKVESCHVEVVEVLEVTRRVIKRR